MGTLFSLERKWGWGALWARSGSGPGRCFPVFPKVDAASPRGLMAPPGLSALGAKGSVRDRLTPPGQVEGSRPRELYSIAALARYGAFGANFYTAFGGENRTTALRARKCIPLWCLTAPPFPRSSVGRQKESALMGRLGALLRPTWRSYAGPPQWHYKAPLCCERLMKGMLRGVLFCPLNRGKVRHSRIRGSRAAANHQNANQAI